MKRPLDVPNCRGKHQSSSLSFSAFLPHRSAENDGKSNPFENVMMYLQTDKRWANRTLDSVPYTIGRWGCLDTSIANGREAIGLKELNPKELSDLIKFTKDGLLIWDSLPTVGVKKVFYGYGWHPIEAKEALKSPDKFCVVELSGYHWGLLYGLFPAIRIHDPLSGVRFLYPKYQITKTVVLQSLV